MTEANEKKKYRVILIEAGKLSHFNSISEENEGLSTFSEKGRRTELFGGVFDYSLESKRLKEFFDASRLPKKMFFEVAGKDYTTSIINVSFDFAKNNYTKIGSQYVLSGVMPTYDDEIINLGENGEIKRIRLYKELDSKPLSDEALGEYFAYDSVNNFYIRRPSFLKGFLVYDGGLCARPAHKPKKDEKACAGTYIDSKGNEKLGYIYLHKKLNGESALSKELLGTHFEYNEEKDEYQIKTSERVREKEAGSKSKKKEKKLDKKLEIVEELYQKRRERAGKASFSVVSNAESLRTELYEKGFFCDGLHYVRYKRSAGSSRSGNCLFIVEALYKKMMAWSRCGLEFEEDEIDLASYEAYISLSLSSIIGEIVVPRESILVLKDAKSTFETKAITINNDDEERLYHYEGRTPIENTIWDGESLLDKSVFEEHGFGKKGMMLLRNRFFKTCAFNTNLSLFFKEKGINDVSQLKGYTEAKSIDQIKMVVTDSSLKYLKIAPKSKRKTNREALISEWLKKTDEVYGVVKTDKPTGYFGGRLVRTSYQLINTLGLDKEKTRALVAPSLEYYDNIRRDPTYLRNYISYTLRADEERDDDPENEELSFYNVRQDVMMDLISASNEISRTEVYKDFRKLITGAFSKKLREGRILVPGTYATLFGNGLEFLYATIGEFKEGDKPLALSGDEVYCKFFENEESLLGCRSPHVTMGNLLCAKNVQNDEIDRYFNLTPEIVCLNAIEANIQQRLNGCDYDSDTMLLTNDKIMTDAAKEIMEKFLVPVTAAEASPKQYKNTPTDQAELDHTIAQNKIGEIINRSQLLNSHYWQMRTSFPEASDLHKEIYRDICILAAMSGMEIDKAKRTYQVNAQKVLEDLNKKYKGLKLPRFFAYGVQEKRAKPTDVSDYDTTMDYLYAVVTEHTRSQPQDPDKIPLSYFVADYKDRVDKSYFKGDTNDSKYINKIEKLLFEGEKKIESLRAEIKSSGEERKRTLHEDVEETYRELTIEIEKLLRNGYIVKKIVEKIDDGFDIDGEERSDKKVRSLALEILCKERGHALEEIIIKTRRSNMNNLVIDENGDIFIYGIPHVEKAVKFAKK